MDNKENVCEKISTAGQEEEEKSPLGKFKDVNALLHAYNSLQAEFTRRSQRLKELEREGNSETGQGRLGEGVAADAVADAPKGGEQGLDEGAEPVLRGLDSPTAETQAVESAQSVGEKEDGAKAGENHTDGDGEKTPSADSIYRMASQDEKVRLQIVSDYLQSLQKTGAPIGRGGIGAPLTPPRKASNIGEAGRLALRMFMDAKEKEI